MELSNRFFIGIKITEALRSDLDSPAPGTKPYFDGSKNQEYLSIIDVGPDRVIGRYLKDGCSAASIADVCRNICSILSLIAHGRRVEASGIHIYSSW